MLILMAGEPQHASRNKKLLLARACANTKTLRMAICSSTVILNSQTYLLVGGGSGHGFKHGPAVGEYVAGIMNDDIPPEPRFALAAKQTTQSRQVV